MSIKVQNSPDFKHDSMSKAEGKKPLSAQDQKIETLNKENILEAPSDNQIAKPIATVEKKNSSIESLKSMTLFESTGREVLLEVQKAFSTPLTFSIPSMIKEGKWDQLIKAAFDEDNIEVFHYSLLASYSQGDIDIHELTQAFIFIDCVDFADVNGIGYQIRQLDSDVDQNTIKRLGSSLEQFQKTPPNLRFEIVLDIKMQRTFCSFLDEQGKYHLPSFTLMQNALDNKYGPNSQKLVPILGLSLREGMTKRIRKNQSDFALIFPFSREKIHGRYLMGPELHLHDLLHAEIRSMVPLDDWDPIMDFADRFESKMKTLEFRQLDLETDFFLPWLKKDANEEDQVYWLMDTLGGLFMEGIYKDYMEKLKANNFQPLSQDQVFHTLKLLVVESLGKYYDIHHLVSEKFQYCLDPLTIHDDVIQKCAQILTS